MQTACALVIYHHYFPDGFCLALGEMDVFVGHGGDGLRIQKLTDNIINRDMQINKYEIQSHH